MLRDSHTIGQAGLAPHEVHCHQYLAMDAVAERIELTGAERTARERRQRGVRVQRGVRQHFAMIDPAIGKLVSKICIDDFQSAPR